MQLFRFLTGARPPLIERAVRDLAAMLDTSAEMFAAATGCLLDNEPLRIDLGSLDDRVNDGEQAVRRAVLEHIVAAPQHETSFSLLLVSVVQDAERCGDLAKTLAKVSELADRPRMGRHVEALSVVRDRVQSAFPRARQAFTGGDSREARALMDEHAQTKDDVATFLREITSDPDLSPNAAAVLAMSARIIGRVSSHLSNIISAVALPFDQVRNAPTWSEE
ncbi:PhoU domain-containing protein [Rubrivirga sp. S365]|uniref:PhoU domain-containing protein n=1 Tax=Rubrivirga litoralis TaxID=3075598 RepID=A0ABU3BNG2_9BACT|nr:MULTISPECIES: PhoU domain-containing protein [unclassified Rubrivirga]MDT0630805.1 PhoU domain-containing protein [Rubrivirga sp. F394]MDT7857356.1 PhoU domain-containing protein [Rubrivirga sp. S365]